jgi:hypothetical protein
MAGSKELATREAGSVLAANDALATAGAMLDKMMALATDPSVDAAKFETIARVVRETREDAKKEQFSIAFAAALLEMPVIDKRGRIVIADKNAPNDRSRDRVQGTFAKWPDLQRAVNPVLNRYDLFLTHLVGHSESMTTVTPVVRHRNGYKELGEAMKLPLDTSGGKNNTQGAGSAASYGKRHTTIAHLGLRVDDSDDDGALNALPDEPLNDQQARRVAEAEARAADGPDAYAAWFAKIEPKDRAWLIQTGRHAKFGGGEATGTAAPPPPPPAQRREERRDPPRQQDAPPAIDTSTPEGWVKQYGIDCAAAKSIEELDGIKAGAAAALRKLSQRHPAEYDKADAHEVDARERLNSNRLV